MIEVPGVERFVVVLDHSEMEGKSNLGQVTMVLKQSHSHRNFPFVIKAKLSSLNDIIFVTIMGHNDVLSWLFTKRFRAF